MQWATVSAATDYEVSTTGLIRRADTLREMRRSPHSGGYLQVGLIANDGKPRKFYVHRLVALAFLPPTAATVNHKNGDKRDNRVENLEWLTVGENIKHSYDNLVRKQHAKTTPVSVEGVTYPSMLACAVAHGVRVGAVWTALRQGRKFQGKEIRRV